MKILLFLIIFAANLLPIFAEDVLFVRNNWKHRLYIMANGQWQGYVDPGRVAYMPQEGFVTEESGFQADGSLRVEHSYGGWPITAQFEIAGISAVFEENGVRTVFYSQGSQAYNKVRYKLWVFGYDNKGVLTPPTMLDTESAAKMRRGRPPQEALDLLKEGLSPEKSPSGKEVIGLVGDEGTSFVLQRSGPDPEKEKKKEEQRLAQIQEDENRRARELANLPRCYQCGISSQFSALRSDGLCSKCYSNGYGDHGRH